MPAALFSLATEIPFCMRIFSIFSYSSIEFNILLPLYIFYINDSRKMVFAAVY